MGEFDGYRKDAWESTSFHGFSDSVSWYALNRRAIVKSTRHSHGLALLAPIQRKLNRINLVIPGAGGMVT
jgi:hypothetical protein